MFDLLKNETKLQHASLEKVFVAQLRSIRTKNEYGAFLSILYSFYSPLEEKILEHVSSNILSDLSERRKVNNLFQDMKSVDYDYQINPNSEVPTIGNASQAIGALYVLEGSTLGGVIISGMLKKQIDLSDKNLSFFTGYGQQTMLKWQAFKSEIEKHSAQLNAAVMVEAAKQTFLLLQKHLQITTICNE